MFHRGKAFSDRSVKEQKILHPRWNAKTIEKHLNLFYCKPTAEHHHCQDALHCLSGVIYCLQSKIKAKDALLQQQVQTLRFESHLSETIVLSKSFIKSLIHYLNVIR